MMDPRVKPGGDRSSAESAGDAEVGASLLPFIPAQAGIQSQGLGPRFRGDERMLLKRNGLRIRRQARPANCGGPYFAGLGFELRRSAPPEINPKLRSSSSAA